MSDFIFSATRRHNGELPSVIQAIYHRGVPDCWEYHGGWGSLAVSRGHYSGFDPVETGTHIAVVVGGPVLLFRDNIFLNEGDRQTGTRAILERMLSGQMDWENDLSGPFVVLLVDKQRGEFRCVTDLMMFIPVYEDHEHGGLVIGTHVDAVASASGREVDFDEASLVDFILHDVVTYPYTAYRQIRQLCPAAEHLYTAKDEGQVDKAPALTYWQPVEGQAYANIDEAAETLRSGLQGYVDSVTEGMNHVAQFISGGEDSRALAGLLPADIQRDAYIFLDSMNREGRVAEKVADAYEVSFYPRYRSPTHYLEILEEASALVGLGHQYTHAHSLGFHEECGLDRYPAVFGGYLSDSLLKGAYARKPRGYEWFPFLPQFCLHGEARSTPIRAHGFSPEVLREIEHRRHEHLTRVKDIRPSTAHEWFVLWPMTMRHTIPNFYSSRRLFASYEPFMANSVVKVSASVPTRWKLNRRLFLKAVRPWLQCAKTIPHAGGHFPHLPWFSNLPIQAPIWILRQISRRTGLEAQHNGPWAAWHALSTSSSWAKMAAYVLNEDALLTLPVFARRENVRNVYSGLKWHSQMNLFQVSYSLANAVGNKALTCSER